MSHRSSALSAFVICLLTASSCRQKEPATPLPVTMDDSSRAIIDRAIAYAGGYDTWQEKKTLSFVKRSTSYDSTGKVVRELEQHFDYILKPEFRARISYRQNDTAVTVIHDGQRARKLYNGTVSDVQKDIDGAWNSSFGSQFVISMPFKLKDPGIRAEYIGQVTLTDGSPAQAVKTSYAKGAGSSPDHIWYYYFEPGTGRLLANSLQGKDFLDFTRYEGFEKAGNLLIPAFRKSYAADTLNRPRFQVSQSRHEKIVFDKEFPEGHFKIGNGN